MMQINSYVSDRQKKRKKGRVYFFSTVAVLFLYLLFFGTVWFVFHSPLFRVSDVVVKGNDSVASSDVVSLLQADASPRHNFFGSILGFGNMFLWPDQVATSELAMIPQLADISVSKDYWSHTVTATVAERQPLGVWCYMKDGGNTATSTVNGSCFWFDDAGTIFQRGLNTQGNLILTVDDYSQNPSGLNQKILPDEFDPNLVSILNVIQQSGLNVKTIALNDIGLQEIDVTTVDGPDVYFSLRFSADEDLPVIQSIMSQPDFSKLEYIDCRTENRVFYK